MLGGKNVKVLITEKIHPVLARLLRNWGFNCTVMPKATYLDVLDIISKYNGLVVRSGIRVDKTLLDAGKNLQFVGRTGSGMELIDVAYAQSLGISCLHSPEGNCPAVGEHAVGLIIDLLRNITVSNNMLKGGSWQRIENTGTALTHKTIGIIGYGNTGRATAKRLQGFDVRVLAYDKYRTNYSDQYATESSWEELFKQADIVSFHVPLTNETQHLVNAALINSFKRPIYLINTSRGGVVDTGAVIAALENGQLRGAALDVFEQEPLLLDDGAKKWKKLATLRNVLLTPHIAGVTHRSFEQMALVLAYKTADLYNIKVK